MKWTNERSKRNDGHRNMKINNKEKCVRMCVRVCVCVCMCH
jgi:hypothetical protein